MGRKTWALTSRLQTVPFNVTYGLIMSPFFCILLPLLMVMLWSRGGRDDGRGMPFRKRILLFAYAKDVADGKGVPARDPRLAYLPEVPPYAQMNMTLEWVLGWGYRVWSAVFPPEKPSPEELRYQDDPAFAAY